MCNLTYWSYEIIQSKLNYDERLSFLGTFICVVYENRWCGFWIRKKLRKCDVIVTPRLSPDLSMTAKNIFQISTCYILLVRKVYAEKSSYGTYVLILYDPLWPSSVCHTHTHKHTHTHTHTHTQLYVKTLYVKKSSTRSSLFLGF